MHLFWNNYIEPVLKLTKSKKIVEIGAEYGHNSLNIIKFCQENDARCHIIDPLRVKELEINKEVFDLIGEYHQGLSLEVLPELEPCDAYLIDGDHNWYTVYNELKQIYKTAKEQGRTSPICLMHDMNWPYARRDMYYEPSRIPEGYRHPSEVSGIVKGQSKLSRDGINKPFHNALKEGGPQNGILTAVEDFVNNSEVGSTLYKVPGFNGLGILIADDLTKEVKEKIVAHINDTNVLREHIFMMEQDRLDLIKRVEKMSNEKISNKNELDKVLRENIFWKNKYETDVAILSEQIKIYRKELSLITSSRTYRHVSNLWRFKKKITGDK